MIPVDQDIFYAEDQEGNVLERGNCRSACVASILEIELHEVPYFVQFDDWHKVESEFLKSRGFDVKWSYGFGYSKPEGFSVAVGVSPRSRKDKTLFHAVVCFDGEVVFDPHPDRTGICGPVQYYHTIVKMSN